MSERTTRRAVPDTVIFDLGGVLIDWNPRYLYRHLFDDESSMEQFLAEVCDGQWNEQQDAGRSWDEAIRLRSAEFPEHAALIAAYRTRWDEMLRGPMHDSVAILEELRARGVRLYALTNWSQETFPLAFERYPFLRAFEGIVVSGQERMIKPDPAIFQLLLNRYGIDPGRAVYVDDAPRNVDAAAKLGMHALQFRDAAVLRGELLALGLLDGTAPEVRQHG
ncbi:HAD family phosphatase [Rhodanobacter sp. FDAARGOS 1247]|uniref:HAD family hydrolase n=1 Tax=Rhodanobacter sp. FDAARGOS 1247 TaxID=2778082 RepID=UPI00194FF3E2|nr:HAD family phosphatase [Rhodanobacter sp. FDAARGOS 1247]QRP65114.1 HAD family phosphatase [Rhodanobacter sp. FDAARGOS 1247]